jgi:hypothetical protein
MSWGKREIETVILNTLDYDKSRAAHTPNSLVDMFRGIRVVQDERDEMAVRMCVAELIREGRLGMTPQGRIIPPEEEADPIVEQFRGSFFVTLDGRVLGPMTHTEAMEYALTKVHAGERNEEDGDASNGHAGKRCARNARTGA